MQIARDEQKLKITEKQKNANQNYEVLPHPRQKGCHTETREQSVLVSMLGGRYLNPLLVVMQTSTKLGKTV